MYFRSIPPPRGRIFFVLEMCEEYHLQSFSREPLWKGKILNWTKLKWIKMCVFPQLLATNRELLLQKSNYIYLKLILILCILYAYTHCCTYGKIQLNWTTLWQYNWLAMSLGSKKWINVHPSPLAYWRYWFTFQLILRMQG